MKRAVLRHAGPRGRTLPWRGTRDPYAIFVSEVMLQQTQVERVIPKYEAFLKRFPSWASLANASFEEVLARWVGLGYNRRAKFLHEAAKEVVLTFGGTLPKDPDTIATLPGVGPYTAAAVAAFAFHKPAVFIETNIRTVFLFHCFLKKKNVKDAAILPLVEESLRGKEPARWYAALMDYGAHLKRQGVRLNGKSSRYVRQKKFEGSTRELRGTMVRLVVKEAALSLSDIASRTGRTRAEVRREATRLAREGMLRLEGGLVSGSR